MSISQYQLEGYCIQRLQRLIPLEARSRYEEDIKRRNEMDDNFR
jgi:hypothetical protein